MTPLMIDASSTRDRDDALWVEPNGDGWRLHVAVADVASGVAPGSPEDQAARRRGRTVYGPEKHFGMLPSALERALTLTPHKDRPALQVTLEVDSGGVVTSRRLQRATVSGARVLTYQEVPEALADPSHPAHQSLTLAESLAKAMLHVRREAGALAFYDLIRGWAVTEEGDLVRLGDPERNIGYIIVQEAMIAANAAMATWAVENDVPILFRNHFPAAASPAARVLAQDLEAALLDSSLTAMWHVQRRLGLVTRAATYAPHARGHFALTLPAYTHATSPLRRYPDIVTQRQIFAALDGAAAPHGVDELEAIAHELNEMDRLRRERKGEELKERAHRAARSDVHNGELAAVDPQRFSATLKRACKEGLYSESLATETLRRARAEALSLADLHAVLLMAEGEPWRSLKEELVPLLAEQPHRTPSLLSIHAQTCSATPVSYWDETQGNSPAQTFHSQATLGEVRGAKRRAGTKKAARQQATLSLLARLAGTGDPSADIAPASAPQRPVEKRTALNGQNPVAYLNELTQVGHLPELNWKVKQSGPPHAPVFTAYVSAGEELRASGSAGTKAGARERAAKALFERLKTG
jgi:ribonuclease R